MSIHRRDPKRDGNERSIIDVLEGVGATVYQLSGYELPDLLVYFRGVWFVGEVKMLKGKLRDSQNWDETIEPGAVPVWRTPDDALATIGAI